MENKLYMLENFEENLSELRDKYSYWLEKFEPDIKHHGMAFSDAIYIMNHPELELNFKEVMESNELQKIYKDKLVNKFITEQNFDDIMAAKRARGYIIALKRFIRFMKTNL